MGKKTIIGASMVAALASYFSLWPVDIDPKGWTPAAQAPLVARVHLKLAPVERLANNAGTGPEGVSFDAKGRIYGGFVDGRVVRLSEDGKQLEVLANTGGRPWGTFASADGGSVLVADAIKGLLQIKGGQVTTLATQANGIAFAQTDDVVQASTGEVYFSDASARFGPDKIMAGVFAHDASGRLLKYDPVRHSIDVLMSGLHVANGVTLGPDEAYLLVAETLSYRVWRYWLKGPKAGQQEVFIDNLPGFPDNVSFNGRDGFWLALSAPRDALLDQMLPHPGLLKAAYRIPTALQPKAKNVARILKIGLDGEVLADLAESSKDAYAPITSVRERDGVLYLGSIAYPAFGRMKVPDELRLGRPGVEK